MTIILNEREFAEQALETCELGEHPYNTLSCLAKYYHAEGYRDREVRRFLENFLLKCDPSVNVFRWEKAIARTLKTAKKYPLVEVDCVSITAKEMAVCESLSGRELKQFRPGRHRPTQNTSRLMFTLICLAKYGNAARVGNNGWVNASDKDIFALANVSTTIRRQSFMLNKIHSMGLLQFSKKVDNVNMRVTCIDEEGEPVMQVSDFRNLGNQYMMYHGFPYIECASCGLVVPKGNNSHRLCKQCGEARNREKTNENHWKRKGELPPS